MRAGVSFPSYPATFSGSATAGFPASRLSDMRQLRRVAKPSGAVSFALEANRQIGFVGLVHHNGGPSSTGRLRLYAGTSGSGGAVFDSGVVNLFPGDRPTLYPQTYPFVLDAPVTAGSGVIDLTGVSSLGAVEVAGWWEWANVAVPRELGIEALDQVDEQAGGASHGTAMWRPRMFSLSRGIALQSENETTAIDFALEKGVDRPFVFVLDADDPTSWARSAVAVTNTTLNLPANIANEAGRQSYAFTEHL